MGECGESGGPIAPSWVRAIVRRSFVRFARWLDLDPDPYVREIAKRSRLEDHVIYGDPSRVHIGRSVGLNDALLNVSSGDITIEDTAFFGHGVSILTGTHDTSARGIDRHDSYPRGGRDVIIGTGAWIGSNATVLGPCTVGAHAVVAAGAVVTRDVAPATVVAGVPARIVGTVPDEPAS